MPRVVRVVPEDLTVSAAHVDAHADNLRARQAASDVRIQGAQPGLPAGAAAALDGAAAKWQEVTVAHYSQMVDHSTSLRSASAAYSEVDSTSAEDLNGAGQAISTQDLGL